MSEFDFEANAKEGIAIDWPIRYKDLAPWYSYVEKYIGVSGEKLGLPQLPDSEFLKPMELTCAEEKFKNEIASKYDDRLITNARVAHITEGTKPGLAVLHVNTGIDVEEVVLMEHILVVIHLPYRQQMLLEK